MGFLTKMTLYCITENVEQCKLVVLSPASNYYSTLYFTANNLFVITKYKNEMHIADFCVCTNE